jgi:hypothetical protein
VLKLTIGRIIVEISKVLKPLNGFLFICHSPGYD